MSSPITWAVYDNAGLPLAGLTPTFDAYCTKAGVARAQPVITDMTGGQYGFLPTDADEAAGTLYLVNNGVTGNPMRVSGSVTTLAAPFAVWHLEDANGDLWTGAAPTVSNVDGYASLNGARGAPPVVAAQTYLFSLTPSLADLLVGVAMRADSPATAYPEYYQQTLAYPPNTAVVSAGAGVSITHTQVTSIDAAGLFKVVETVIDSTGLVKTVFAYDTTTGIFNHVATAGELQALPNTQGAAVTANTGYYLQDNATVTYSALADALEMVSIFNLRLQALCTEQARLLDGFAGSLNLVVTP